MTTELGDDSLDEACAIARIERPGKVKQDRHGLISESNRVPGHAALSSGWDMRCAKLEEEIDRLQRTEEAVVVATGAPREAGCPPWVVLVRAA
jgi:hypothetical protein